MRLALVYRSFHLAGSLARETVELARHLSQGHEVHIFSIRACTDRSLAPGCSFHDVPVLHIGDGARFSAREIGSFARNAAALLSRERFDIVHTCAPSTWVSDVLHVPGVAREEAKMQGIPKWRYGAAAVRRPGDAVRRRLERKALTYSGLQRLHAAAPSVRDALVRGYAIAPDDVLIVPPAVNLSEFRPAVDKAARRIDLGIDDPCLLVVLFCGNDFQRKGLDRAIIALPHLRASASLLVVGNGPETSYRRLAAEHGVSERVRFFGGRQDAWRFYHAADLLVLPTRADVWGITPIEAMASAVPPIVSAAAGSASAVSDGETGVVLPEPFDPRALARVIDWLAADPARRAAMGRAGVAAATGHGWAERARLVEQDLLAVAERRAKSSVR